MVLSHTIMYLYQITRECLSGGAVKEMWLRAVQTQLRLLKLSREPPLTLSSTLLDDGEEQIPRICWIQTFPIDSTTWPANSHIRMTRELGNQQVTQTAYTVHVDPGPDRWTGKAGRSLTQHVAKMKSDTTFKNTSTHRWCPAGRICPSRDTTHSTFTSLQILRVQHPTVETAKLPLSV